MPKKELIEGEHYYYDDDGLMVLTAKFLRERGYCCANRCKHCPYSEEEFQAAFAKKKQSRRWW